MVRLPNGEQLVMGSIVASSQLRDIYEVYNREVRKLVFEPKAQCL